MRNQRFNTMNRTLAILLSLVIAAFTLSACDSDSADSGNKTENTSGKNNDDDDDDDDEDQGAMSLKHGSDTMTADVSISLVNSMMFQNRGQLMSTIIASWTNPDGKEKFGVITARLGILGERDADVATASYEFVDDIQGVDSKKMVASLVLQDSQLKDAPTHLISKSGTLKLKSVTYKGSKVTSLSFDFDGKFANSEDSEDTKDYAVSGSVIVNEQ